MKAQHIAAVAPHELAIGQWTNYRDGVYARCPNGLIANLTEHERHVDLDGESDHPVRLTISPSIACDNGEGGLKWHGFIERGIWLDENHQPVRDANKSKEQSR